jgi:hypothetical protein
VTDAPEVWTLFFGKIALGAVANLSFDQPWVHGDLTLFDSTLPFHRLFDACTNEVEAPPEPGGEFPDEYFDDERWHVAKDDGAHREICLPAIHRDTNSIFWRWR